MEVIIANTAQDARTLNNRSKMSEDNKTQSGWKDNGNHVLTGLDDQKINIETQFGTVSIDAPQTPAKLVMALRECIGLVEDYYPKETPYPKTVSQHERPNKETR